MKINLFKIHAISFFLGVMVLSSCNSDGNDLPSEEESKWLEVISVVPVWKEKVSASTKADDNLLYTDPILEDQFVDGESVLYISQLYGTTTPFSDVSSLYGDSDDDELQEPEAGGETTDPDNETDVENPDPDSDQDNQEDTSPINLYHYTYGHRPIYPNPDWDEGYNFFPTDPKDMINWETVRAFGPYGNGYALCALYLPFSNDFSDFNYEVKSDQSTLENLKRSNILGAKHTTSSLFSRLQFQLYHLMVYLKVKVYVPVFKDGDPDARDEKDQPSGYSADALEGAEIINVYNKYTINWKTRGSEYAPLTTADVSDENNMVASLKMYRHPFPDNGTIPAITSIKVSEFYSGLKDMDYDDVYVYEFSALIPAQPTGFANTNFLKFPIKSTMSGGKIKNYVFSSQQRPEGSGSSDIELYEPGYRQTLELYLPRNHSAAVLIKAEVDPWTEVESDMHVSPIPKKDTDTGQ